jgi:hypothetical protein
VRTNTRRWAWAVSLLSVLLVAKSASAEEMGFTTAGLAYSEARQGSLLAYDYDFGVSSSSTHSVTASGSGPSYATPSTTSAEWTLSASQVDVTIDHLTSQLYGSSCKSYGYVYFTVDAPCSYTLSGEYAFASTNGFAASAEATLYVFLAGGGQTLCMSYQYSLPTPGGTFTLGGASGASNQFTGSLTGNLSPGTTYVLFYQANVGTYPAFPNLQALSGEGTVSLAIGAPLEDPPAPPDGAVDTDGDGLSDEDEGALGSDPLSADTDDDGLSDGAEVEMSAGAGCPDLLVADSDGDSLPDGAEVDLGTSPCDADTDDDGASDDLDPDPLEPGAPTAELAAWAEAIADDLAATELSSVAAPNTKSAAGRLGALVTRVESAARAIEDGDLDAARDLLASVRLRLDGLDDPDDWLLDSPARAALLREIEALEGLLA